MGPLSDRSRLCSAMLCQWPAALLNNCAAARRSIPLGAEGHVLCAALHIKGECDVECVEYCRQGKASFGDSGVFVEKYVQRARHIEVCRSSGMARAPSSRCRSASAPSSAGTRRSSRRLPRPLWVGAVHCMCNVSQGYRCEALQCDGLQGMQNRPSVLPFLRRMIPSRAVG